MVTESVHAELLTASYVSILLLIKDFDCAQLDRTRVMLNLIQHLGLVGERP